MALIDRHLDALLLRTLRHLGPYLDEVVVVGGVANALYRYHELAAAAAGRPVGTRDLDLAAPASIPPAGRPKLADLLEEAGLRAEVHPAYQPPIMKFTPRHDPDVELEFLCPLVGGGRTRSGAEKLAAEIQAGVTAQQLRYLDLLLSEPWEIATRRVPALAELPAKTVFRVPNPAAYVVQKVLIRDQGRPSSSRAKDCYYMYETAVVFRDALGEVGRAAAALRSQMPKKWSQRYSRELRRLFASSEAEGPVAAAREQRGAASGEGVDEALVYAAMRPLVDVLTE